MANEHVKPVGEDEWKTIKRIYPNLHFTHSAGFGMNVFAPCDGVIDLFKEDTIIFKHKGEPYYSMFNPSGADTWLELAKDLVVGQEIGFNHNLGVLRLKAGMQPQGELLWRVGADGNKVDWMDPEKWLKGDFAVWPKDAAKDVASSTNWGDLALWGGGLYLAYKALNK